MVKVYQISPNTSVKVYMQKKGESSNFFGEHGYHDVYRIIMDFGYGKFTTTFHNSIANYGKPINEKDIDSAVDCIINDFFAYKNNPYIQEFLNEFGYDCYDKKLYNYGCKAYNGCCSVYKRLSQFVTADELSDLQVLLWRN